MHMFANKDDRNTYMSLNIRILSTWYFCLSTALLVNVNLNLNLPPHPHLHPHLLHPHLLALPTTVPGQYKVPRFGRGRARSLLLQGGVRSRRADPAKSECLGGVCRLCPPCHSKTFLQILVLNDYIVRPQSILPASPSTPTRSHDHQSRPRWTRS